MCHCGGIRGDAVNVVIIASFRWTKRTTQLVRGINGFSGVCVCMGLLRHALPLSISSPLHPFPSTLPATTIAATIAIQTALTAEMKELQSGVAEKEKEVNFIERNKTWNWENMCHVTEERTIINKSAESEVTSLETRV